MAKRDINVFNVSFLDLLSGALGAVLILFIVIPKLTGDIILELEQLEQMKELKVDVQKIENMMVQLKESVPEATFNELQSRMEKLTTTISQLEKEIKTVQSKLAECDAQRKRLNEQVKDLKKQVVDLEERIKNNDKIVQQLQSEIEDLRKQIEQIRSEKEALAQEVQDLKNTVSQKDETIAVEQTKVEDLTENNEALKRELEKAKNEAEAAKAEVNKQKTQLKECQAKLGLDVGDNVVFVVDISGSMDDDPEPQKLDEVKAGIKMMVATMDESTSVDIVIYPKSADERYGYKYGRLQPVTEDTKYDIYRYLATLRAYGCTPTKEVMDFVFDSPNYKNANTIILMSDGLPTVRTSATKCDEVNSTAEIEDYITGLNGGSKVINCIGVGSDFRQRNSNDLKVKFMQNLARKNGGFYIGF